MRNTLYILLSFVVLLSSSCTKHFIQTKIPKNPDKKVVGLVVQFGGVEEDTSIISRSLFEGLSDCKLIVVKGFFKDGIFEKENFDRLFNLDSTFIKAQPTLINLPQMMVVRINYKIKESEGKKSFGIELLARWISMAPLKMMHEFYYVEIMNNAAASTQNKTDIKGFLAQQIHVKLCYEIRKYITHVN